MRILSTQSSFRVMEVNGVSQLDLTQLSFSKTNSEINRITEITYKNGMQCSKESSLDELCSRLKNCSDPVDVLIDKTRVTLELTPQKKLSARVNLSSQMVPWSQVNLVQTRILEIKEKYKLE